MERFSNVNLVERFANVNRYYDLVSKMHDHKRKAIDVKEWEENYFKPGFKIFKILPKVIKAIDEYYGPDTFATSLAQRTKLLYRDKLVYDLAAFGLFERANEAIDNLDIYPFFKESIDTNNMRAFITEYADFSELAIKYIIENPRQAYKKDIINHTASLNYPTYIQQYFFRSSKLITKVKNSDRYALISEKDIEEYNKRKEAKRLLEIRRNERRDGDYWINETKLYNIVCKIFRGNHIYRHYRPEWLLGLEIDIYIPDKKLAIEYQGIQHYEAIAHWGGKKALERQIERDIIKREFCQEKGVSLIEVKYTERLEINYIKAKLKKFL